jgi:myo-inositol-1(or 4)-monophosphatase
MLSPEAALELADLARLAATRAGELLAELAPRRRDLGERATAKSSQSDVVTTADLESESIILEVLLGARPDDAVLAEEGSGRGGTSPVTWIVDPLDGTTNFIYGFGSFSVSIAARYDDTVVAGVVHDPIANETFMAALGAGATRNGVPLVPNHPSSLSLALVGTGFGYRPSQRAIQGRLLPALLPAVRDLRRGGSAALDCCSVAAGRLDAYFEAGLNPWDYAAGLLIATEAGCGATTMADFPPGENTLVIASGDLLDAFVDLLRASDLTGEAIA